jgi:prepilin-type processing-associated H-X9-DG protein
MEGRAYVPLLLDSRYPGVRPRDDNKPPPEKDLLEAWLTDMSDFCIDRHQGHVNGLFGDASVRKTGLKELWTLKWHKQFNTSNRWTKVGGVQAEDWPQWMRKFKDY